ncbi:hypothetical protein BC941DRAFT_420641 [Chlamydoabsidia padenii]|nr:hypothetical protein BC941DRAFT_420641 [Chlamydoabsidia padenii]
MPSENETEKDSTRTHSRHSSMAPISGNNSGVSKKTFRQRFQSWLPTQNQLRKDLKASIALIIAMVMTLDIHTRKVIGDTVLLVPIVVIFYFPVRTYGVQTEAVVYGTFGALISGLYSLLGTYLANLARDHTIKNPNQPGPSAILAVFLFFGTFILNYVRMKFHKANFAAVNACILLSFTLTGAASIPIFATELTWIFLRPIATAGAIALAVNYFIWPDDSVNNYMRVLQGTLSNHQAFFKENSEAFLNMQTSKSATTLSTLQTQLHSSILLLIDCKRAAQREILYSNLNGQDFSKLTHLAKSMLPSLHGLGLSVILQKDYLNRLTDDPLLKDTTSGGDKDDLTSGFKESVSLMKSSSEQLVQITVDCLNKCKSSLACFQPSQRTDADFFMWPFPRLLPSSKTKRHQEMEKINEAYGRLTESLEQLDMALEAFDQAQRSNGLQRYHQLCHQKEQYQINQHVTECNNCLITTYGPLYLVYLYQNNIREYCGGIQSLANIILQFHQNRTSRKIHLPQTTLRKWFNPTNEVDPTFFNSNNNNDSNNGSSSSSNNNNGGTEAMADATNLSLVQTRTRSDPYPTEKDAENGFVKSGDPSTPHISGEKNTSSQQSGRGYSRLYMDPDVSPPSTSMERFFNSLHKVFLWLKDIDTAFALKSAMGMVMLAIPAWMPANAGWFQDWRGEWSLITLCLWLFPTPGMFFFGLYTRVLGSVVGAVMGIVVWEITRGNPYGLGVLCFVLFIPYYHVFFFSPIYRVASLMGKITMILVVVYAYNAVQEGGADIEPVWTIAGKRLLAVVVGIVAAGILLLFPAPVQGRIELRKRLARTIRDIGRLYGIVTAEMTAQTGSPTSQQQKAFRRLALNIRRQIADERNLLAHSKYEPPLRGKFPQKSYAQILQIVDSLSGLVYSMGHAIKNVNPEWRKQMGNALLNERREYLASIMTTLKLVSATLAAKTPLPPYLVEPDEARERFAKTLEHQISFRPADMDDPSFPSYSTFMMNGSAFVTELQKLLDAVTDLVGVENPEEWLLMHA